MPGPDPHDRPPSRPEDPRLWRVAVGATAALTYLRTVTFGWVYDDQMEVVRNVFIRSWRSLPSIFTSTAWEGSGMETFLYRPVTISSYLVNHAVSGLEPWSYHLANVGLHAFVSILVFQVGRLWRLPVVAAGG
ncbi:MAG: hypothetical protein OEZ37_01190, partial [Gemmatimonadota bacterium]|nr:hypothetical protein [Gemmatimonadota bacterium]